jgi:hypothetical protein
MKPTAVSIKWLTLTRHCLFYERIADRQITELALKISNTIHIYT